MALLGKVRPVEVVEEVKDTLSNREYARRILYTLHQEREKCEEEGEELLPADRGLFDEE